jgi:hypothetical protein
MVPVQQQHMLTVNMCSKQQSVHTAVDVNAAAVDELSSAAMQKTVCNFEHQNETDALKNLRSGK